MQRKDERLPIGSIRRYEPPRPLRYTMADLEREANVASRTIRYYITQGLLPPAYGRGPSATYDADHLLRLRFIKSLKDDRLSLEDIRERIGEMTPEDIAAALRVEIDPSFDTWRHYALHEDLDIAVRDRIGPARDAEVEQAIDLIIEYARSVIAELDERRDPSGD